MIKTAAGARDAKSCCPCRLMLYRRGAGNSKGRTSWSLTPEIGDYTSMVLFMALFLAATRASAAKADPMSIITGGYSFGSMVASNLPTIREMLAEISTREPHKVASVREIRRQASLAANVAFEQDPIELPTVFAQRLLLISPLLPPVTKLLAAFSGHSLAFWRTTSLEKARDNRLVGCPSLICYGEHDQFTSAAKLSAWICSLQVRSEGRLTFFHDAEADHFWRSAESIERLRRFVHDFGDAASTVGE